MAEVMECRMNKVNPSRDHGPRRPTHVSLSDALLTEARSLGVNVSRACELGLSAAVREEKARQWQERNAAGFEAWNEYVERHGVPLSEYRKF
jgi:antitoxin CcdA